MEWLPTERAAVENVATPEPLRVPVPRVAAPSLKVTVPVGVPPVPVTVAVKLTDCPYTDGFDEEVSVVVLGLTTASVGLAALPPEPVELLPPHVGPEAVIVKVVEAAGVAPVVAIVNVA